MADQLAVLRGKTLMLNITHKLFNFFFIFFFKETGILCEGMGILCEAA